MRELFSALEPCERVLWQEDTAARDALEQGRNWECGFADAFETLDSIANQLDGDRPSHGRSWSGRSA